MSLVLATLVLGLGTFGFRFAGPVLKARMHISARFERIASVGVVVLLAALVATAALTDGHHFTGPARPLGVAAGCVLAWRRAPFALVVVVAAATAALLRLAGVP